MNFMCNGSETCRRMSQNLLAYGRELSEDQKNRLDNINSLSGSPIGSMSGLMNDAYSHAAHAIYYEKDLQKSKYWNYVCGKLFILSTSDKSGGDYEGFNLNNSYSVASFLFSILLSDSPKLRQYLVNNLEQIANSETNPRGIGLSSHLYYSTLLALEGKQLDRLEARCQAFLSDYAKADKKRVYDYEFLLAFARQDMALMRAALEPLLKPGQGRIVGREVQNWYDFWLQPQIVFYAKLASIHGFDLGFDQEETPAQLIKYDPLPEGSYTDPFDFMKAFDLDWPHEFSVIWADYYRGLRNDLNYTPPKRS